jgi:prepilin-type N-terminal cleavage/methylation domain-containing protein
MRIIAPNRRYARIARRRSGEQGLTLIELLLSLAILAVLTSFLAGGLSMGRRAFLRSREQGRSVKRTIQVISNLIGSIIAIPAVRWSGIQCYVRWPEGGHVVRWIERRAFAPRWAAQVQSSTKWQRFRPRRDCFASCGECP